MPYKKHTGEKLPLHLVHQIQGICGDFNRRACEIEKGRRREEVIDLYIETNTAILDALNRVCVGDCDKVKLLMLEAVGERRGHAWSPLCTMMSPAAFYERKYRIMQQIAYNLKLM